MFHNFQPKNEGAFLLNLANKSPLTYVLVVCKNTGHKYDVPVFCINEPVSYAAVSKLD